MKLHRIQALLLKYWYFSLSDLSRIFDMIYWPVIGIVVFGFTTLYLSGVTEVPAIIVFLMGGLIVWILFERVQQDVTVFILEDFWSRNIANMFTTPITLFELFFSLIIVGFLRALVTFAIMFAIALGFYQFNVLGGEPSAALFIIPLLLFGWGLGIFVTGIIFRYGPRIQILAWGIAYLVQPISAVYYPLVALPSWLQIAAKAFPLAYSFEGYRLAYSGIFSWEIFAAGCALSLVYMVVFYLYFVYAVRHAKRSGRLVSY